MITTDVQIPVFNLKLFFSIALWSREGSQNKIEGQFSTGQSYASTSGTINTDPGHTMVQLSCEYGASRSSPYSLSLSLDSTSTQTAESSSHTGSLVLEVGFRPS